MFVVPKLFSSVVSIWFSRQIMGILLNFGAASNAPILYFTRLKTAQKCHIKFNFLVRNTARLFKKHFHVWQNVVV
jgi:hypothetical protein